MVCVKIFVFSVLACVAAAATAQPVKCVDAKGKIRYIDASTPGAEKCQPVPDATNIVPPQNPGAMAPAQDSRRRAEPEKPSDAQIAEAEKKLAAAKKNLAEQEDIRQGGERNYERVLERLKPYQDAVAQAERELQDLSQNQGR